MGTLFPHVTGEGSYLRATHRHRRSLREVTVYKQVLDPVSHSLGLTSIFAVLPLVVLFVLRCR
jgi:hypothetical protein